MAISASEARSRLFPLIQQVNDDHLPVRINSKGGDAVLMSADDFDSWQETIYLLRSPANARRLMEAVGHGREDNEGTAGFGRRVVRSIHFDPDAWDDFLYWLGADRKMATRVTRLIGDIQRDPFTGIGKPEPLKGDLSGYWSRRIDDEHRLVYRADDKEVKILKARYHYSE